LPARGTQTSRREIKVMAKAKIKGAKGMERRKKRAKGVKQSQDLCLG
jgi:hypothetical protein